MEASRAIILAPRVHGRGRKVPQRLEQRGSSSGGSGFEKASILRLLWSSLGCTTRSDWTSAPTTFLLVRTVLWVLLNNPRGPTPTATSLLGELERASLYQNFVCKNNSIEKEFRRGDRTVLSVPQPTSAKSRRVSTQYKSAQRPHTAQRALAHGKELKVSIVCR